MDDDDSAEVASHCGRISCRKVIVQKAGRGRPRAYCSDVCRRAADREYKQARARVENATEQLLQSQFEVGFYRRADDDVFTSEQRVRIHLEATAAWVHASAAITFDAGTDDTRVALVRLLRATEPLIQLMGRPEGLRSA